MVFVYFTICGFAYSQYKEEYVPEISTGLSKKETQVALWGMAVTAHPLATEAAKEILQEGGSAIDAAIAAQMVLNLVEPQSSGIGGGGFLVYYDSYLKKIISYDGREKAPSHVKEDHFLDSNNKAISFKKAAQGPESVAIPGLLKMLKKAYDNHGRLLWEDLFSNAIDLAENGFELSPRLHKMLKRAKDYKNLSSDYKRFYNTTGKLKSVGEKITNRKLAETFKLIANQGVKPFYEGVIMEDIINTLSPEPFSSKDFKNYKAKIRSTPCIFYHEYKVCGMGPPSSGGVTIMQSLKMLEKFNLNNYKSTDPNAWNLIISALRIAFTDRNKYLADPDFIKVPTKKLLSDQYLLSKSNQITYNKILSFNKADSVPDAIKQFASIKSFEAPSTTHISIVDTYGNAASITTSIEKAFGSGITTGGGFLLNNQMTDFDFLPSYQGVKVANRVEPNKRPRSSMSPMIIFDANNKLKLVIGSPGGARIIPYVLTRIIAILDWQMELQKAMNMPHIVSISPFPNIEIEDNPSIGKWKSSLSSMGYNIKVKPQPSGIHAILYKEDLYYGAADPRREGIALGAD